jgi:hypothetical protein
MYHERLDVINMTSPKLNEAFQRLQMNCEGPKTKEIWTPKTHPKKKLQQNSLMRHVRCLLTFICLRATSLSYDVAHRTFRS